MSKRKHVAFVSGGLHYNLFNRKSAIDSILCSILTELSHTCYITVNGVDFELLQNKAREEENRDKVQTLLSKPSAIKKLVPAKIKSMLRDRQLFAYHKKLILRLKAGPKPDTVFELLKHGSDIGFELSSHFKVPYLVYYDSPANTQFNEIHGFNPFYARRIERYEKQSIALADKVIVYSNPVKDYLVNMASPADQGKFYVFQTLDYSRLKFIDRENFPDVPIIGFIGSFMKWHRVDQLVNAFNRLRTEGRYCKLYLVGAGEEYEKIKQLVALSPYKQDIEMPGFVDGDKLNEYKRIINIGVMPGSNWYGIPTKVFEYGAAGIVSVSPSTPTIADIFKHEEDLLLFDPNEKDGLYRAIKNLIDTPQLRDKLKTNMETLIKKRFNKKVAVEFYNNLLQQLTLVNKA